MSCDLIRHGDQIVTAVSHGGHVTLTPSGTIDLGGTYAVDLRVAVNGEIVAVAAVVNAASADPVDRLVVGTNTGRVWVSGLVPNGEHAVAIKADGTGFAVACVNNLGRTMTVLRLGPDLAVLGSADKTVSTSQGILDWLAEGVALVDDNFIATLGGVRFIKPMTRGRWTCGQHSDNRLMLFEHDTRRVLASTLRSQKLARIAVLDGAPIVAATGENTFLTRSDFAPIGDESPTDPEDDTPMAKTLPQRAYDVMVGLRARNLDLAHGDDDQRRQLTRMIAEQLAHDLGPRWGTKSTSEGAPQTKDGIAYRLDTGRIDIWDWQNGGTRDVQVRPGQAATYPNEAQHFIAVEPVDHLNAGPTPNPSPPEPPPPTPPPTDDVGARLRMLEHRVQQLEMRRFRIQVVPES